MTKNMKNFIAIAIGLAVALSSATSVMAFTGEDLNNLDNVNANYDLIDKDHATGSFQVSLSDSGDKIRLYRVATVSYDENEGFQSPVWTSEVATWLETEGKGKEFATYDTPAKLGEQSENIQTNFFKTMFSDTKKITEWDDENTWDSAVDTTVIVAGTATQSEETSSGYYVVTNVPLGIYVVVGYTDSKSYSPAVAKLFPERDAFDNWSLKNNTVITLKAADVFLNKYINDKKTDIVSIGETVTFDIDFQLASYADRGENATYTFRLDDIMAAGFDMDQSSFKVYQRAGSSTDWSAAESLDTKYYEKTITVSETGATTIAVVFDYEKCIADKLAEAKKEIRVTYQARVNRNIEIGSEANTNIASLKYETNSAGTATTTINDTVKAYTYALKLIKQDGATTETGITPVYLDDTKFNLYKETLFFVSSATGNNISDSTYYYKGAMPGSDTTGMTVDTTTLATFKSTKDSGGTGGTYVYYTYQVDKDTTFDNGVAVSKNQYVTRVYQIYVLADKAGTYFNGTLTTTGTASGDVIKGLDVGNYYLRETKSHTGYNLLAEDILFSLYQVDASIATSQRNGSYAVFADTPFSTTQTITDDDGYYDMKVLNYKGLTLPSTGGIGTMIFTMIGMIIMFLAMILIIRRGKHEIE